MIPVIRRTLVAVATCSALVAAASAQAASVVLTFEGLSNLASVGNFYNGGAGGNLGISFAPGMVALIDSDVFGSNGGSFANEPSASTIAVLAATTAVMNVAAGFDGGFSFYYTTISATGAVLVYDGLNATGTMLGSVSIAALSNANCSGDPTGAFCNWAATGVGFSGTARSVRFQGVASQVGFDNLTLGSALPFGGGGTGMPEPASLTLVGVAMVGLGLARRRQA